jgi:ornithine cyclodeaminase
MKKLDFHIITGATVEKCLSNKTEIKDIIRDTYILHGEGHTINPDSYFLRFPNKPSNRIIALPAFVEGKLNTAGIKWISSFPENTINGIPRASAVLILNNYETGYPFACIESSIISATRTASSAVLAADLLYDSNTDVKLGIIGNGLIAKYIYQHFKGNNWHFNEIFLYDTNPLESEKFKTDNIENEDKSKVVICPKYEHVLTNSSLVVLTTIAPRPYIVDKGLFNHNPLVLNISLRDLSPEIILDSNNITDDSDHALKADTSVHLAEQLSGNRFFINSNIYEVITKDVKLNKHKPTVFSPFGLGVLDIAIGRYVYEKALAQNMLIKIDNFFHDLKR